MGSHYVSTTRLFGYAGKTFRPGNPPRAVSPEDAAFILGLHLPYITVTEDFDTAAEATAVEPPDPRIGEFVDVEAVNDSDDAKKGTAAQVLHIPTNPAGARPKPAIVEVPASEPIAPPTPVEVPKFVCGTCERSDFKSKASLTRHVNSNHKGDA